MAPWPPEPSPSPASPSPAPSSRAPRRPLTVPSKDTLVWVREGITVLLMLLALPWLVYKLATDPGSVLTGLGKRAANKAV